MMKKWFLKLFSGTSKFVAQPECQHRYVTVNYDTHINNDHPICSDCGRKATNWTVTITGIK